MNLQETLPPPPRYDLTEDRYAVLRAVFSRHGYEERTVLERVGAAALPDIFEGGFHEGIRSEAEDGLDVLIHIFLLGRGLPRPVLEAKLGAEFVEACLGQGLLRDMVRQQRLFATVSIQPSVPEHEGLWIVSDRVVPAPEAMMPGGPDLVYPTVTPSAQVFLRFLPRRECARFLEVCAGCGPAATLAAEFAMQVVASDIDARAVDFARYNARLNETPSFRGVTASLYEKLSGEFGVVAAHPPYMPSDGPVEVFYGGGIDGTDLLRQLIAGLPGRLEPGGLFYAVAMIPEGEAFSAEGRVRQWLGEGASQHDVFLFPLHERTLIEAAYEAAAKLGKGMDAVSRYRRTLLEMGHRGFVYGALVVRRHRGEERAIQVRRKIAERCSWRELLWCVDWETGIKDASLAETFLQSEICTGRELEVQVSHRAGPEGLEAVSFRAIARYPFEMESQLQGWMAMLLGMAGRRQTGAALMEAAQQAGLIHPETPVDEFVRLLAMFVSGGFLECSLCPLPTSPLREEAE
jgi:SAM-dependent methyltransferase